MNEEAKETKKSLFEYSNPIRLFSVLIASIFLVEFGIMVVLPYVFKTPGFIENLSDAAALIVITFPALYYLAFRPLIRKKRKEQEVEETLQRIGARLQEAQEIAVVGSWDWDLATDTHTWSAEQNRIFGRDSNLPALTYEKFLGFIHPDDRKIVEEGTKTALTTGVFQGEYRIIRPNGEERIVDARAVRFLDANGKPVRLAGTVHDVTQHKKLEKELQNKLNDLERTNKLLIDRELKMIELKKENEMLTKKLAQQ